MRILLGVAIISLLFHSVGATQSLADVARQERARREATAVEGAIIYTTETLRAQFAPAVPVPQPVDPELSGAEALEEGGEVTDRQEQVESGQPEAGGQQTVAGGSASDEADAEAVALIAWQGAVAEQRALIQDLEDGEVRQSLAITTIRGRVTAPTGSQQERNQAQVELAVAESQLTDIRTALDEARIELELLETDSPEQ